MSEMPTPEFSRPVRIDQVARLSGSVTIVAEEAERIALMRRFRLLALDRLDADYLIAEENGALIARGRLRAALAQPCVASGVAVPETIDTDFVLRFVAEGEDVQGDELELDAEDVDTIGYSGNVIDMGEAVAETMALSMAPYPRSPDADSYLKAVGVLSEDQSGPFAALLALQQQKKD